jgi:tRNA A-37 threonylcarbamoyl transferase component Bud32
VGQQTGSSFSDELGLNQTIQIGKGADAVVDLTVNGSLIRKRYLHDSRTIRYERARREFEALQRAAEILKCLPGVTCPSPLEITDDGDLIMSFSDGLQLDHALGRLNQETQAHFSRIAQQLRDAIITLGQELPADQLDFSIRNTLVRSDPTSIVLIDFTPRELPVSVPDEASPTEIAIASFITSVLTYQIRRSSIIDHRGARLLRELARTVIRNPLRQRYVDPTHVRRTAWAFFWRQSRNRGWLRYLWFHSAGAVIFAYLLRDLIANSR